MLILVSSFSNYSGNSDKNHPPKVRTEHETRQSSTTCPRDNRRSGAGRCFDRGGLNARNCSSVQLHDRLQRKRLGLCPVPDGKQDHRQVQSGGALQKRILGVSRCIRRLADDQLRTAIDSPGMPLVRVVLRHPLG